MENFKDWRAAGTADSCLPSKRNFWPVVRVRSIILRCEGRGGGGEVGGREGGGGGGGKGEKKTVSKDFNCICIPRLEQTLPSVISVSVLGERANFKFKPKGRFLATAKIHSSLTRYFAVFSL